MSNRRCDAGLRSTDFVMTLEEVGHALGVSRERVRQLENRALKKARAILARKGFTLQDFLDGEHNG